MTIWVPSMRAAASCLRVLVDRLHHALRMLDLVDRVLELLVEHPAVGDHDDAVEDLLVVLRCEGWPGGARARRCCWSCRCRPSAGSGSCGPGPSLASAGDDLPHRVELMVAREDHRFPDHPPLSAVAVVDLLFPLLDEHEVAEDVEEAVALEHLLPEVAGAVAGRMLRIARAALYLARMAAAVEWKEVRLVASAAASSCALRPDRRRSAPAPEP